ncbi:MAG: hypothetical protein HQL66_03255 [Magnetococcales bacterium]|nr:hypothetical protein [Magnetococcales bacterium]
MQLPITDYLFLEKEIIARLAATVPGLPVLAIDNEAQLRMNLLPVTSAFVWMIDDRPGEVMSQGRGQKIHQSWLVELVTKNAAQPLTGTAARQEAGPIMMQIREALVGWTPNEYVVSRFRQETSAVKKMAMEGGIIIRPLQFGAEFTLKTNN